MTKSNFIQNYSEVQAFLTKFNLLKNYCKYDESKSFSILNNLDYFSREDYRQTLNRIRSQYAYSFLLNDDSIFQIGSDFSRKSCKIKYVFMQNLHEIIPFEEIMPHDDFKDLTEEEYQIEKEKYYDSGAFDVKEFAFPLYIRYDYDECSYKSQIHPCSHIHLLGPSAGHIASNIIWTPMAFVSFCLRIGYFDKITDDKIDELNEKHFYEFQKCNPVSDEFWTDKDKEICHLYQFHKL